MPSGLRACQPCLVALRELRSNKATFLLSVLTMLLATAMLTAILGMSDSLRSTLVKDARNILGGDFEIRRTTHDFTAEELGWLAANTERASRLVTVRAAAFTDELTSLLVLRVVEDGYPLYGQIALASGEPYEHALLTGPAERGVPSVVARDFAAALNLQVGDVFELGQATLQIADIIERIPDPNSSMLLNAPVVLIARANFAATGLDQPGTLKTFRIKIDSGATDPAAWRAGLDQQFPEHSWRVRGTGRVLTGLQDVISRTEALLLLVSLGTLLIAGICTGNTISTFLRERINSIAMLKSLGMPARQVRLAYWAVAMACSAFGVICGMPLGFGGQWLLVNFLSSQLPFDINFALSVRNALLVPAIMLVAAWIFTIRPLHVFSTTSPISLFSLSTGYALVEENMPRAGWYKLAALSCGLVALLLLAASNRTFLLYFTLGGMATLVTLKLLARAVITIVGKIRTRRPTNSIALRLVARSAAQVNTAAVSLGIGLSILLTFAFTEANFNSQLNAALSAEAPAYYLAGMQPGDEQRIRTEAASWLQTDGDLLVIPTNRARITHLAGVPVEEIEAPENIDWIIHGDRYITWTDDQANRWTGASRVSKGQPWGPDNSQLLVSFDAEGADGLGLAIGDTVDIRMLDQNYRLTVANLRKIDWTTFDVNFAMVLSDGPWREIPHGYLGSVRAINGDHFEFQRLITKIAPSVTPIRTETIVNSATGLLRKIGVLLNLITLTAIVSGVTVLAAAIAEGRHRRIHDSIVLRMLGTSQKALGTVFNVEFLVIAALATLPSLIVALLASFSITTWILNIGWETHLGSAAAIICATLAIVLALGHLGTRRIIANPPLDMLRNE